jgi:predicted dehydrogenase
VVNLTPVDLHARTTRTALTRGLHVLTEKPLAFTLEEARQLAALAREQGLVLGVMSNRGSDSRFVAFCQAIRALGPGPYAATVEMLAHLPSPGLRGRLRYPALQDLAVHAFDQARQLVTAPARTVACFESPLRPMAEACGWSGPGRERLLHLPTALSPPRQQDLARLHQAVRPVIATIVVKLEGPVIGHALPPQPVNRVSQVSLRQWPH